MQKLLTPKTVTDRYGLKEAWLAKLRMTGKGPEFIKMGRRSSRIYYEESAIEAWLASKRRRSTSDAGSAQPVRAEGPTP